MVEATERQLELLRIIIEEYAEGAEPIGSKNLVEKYDLAVSPATVRNEMAALVEAGYLEQPHTSAGRAPTALGLRYYIGDLMEERPLPVLQEVAIKQRLWQDRFETGKCLRQVALAAADATKHLALVVTDDGHIHAGGAASVLDNPEFFDIDVAREALFLLDDHPRLEELFGKASGDRDVHVLIGDEMGGEHLAPCGLVFSRFGAGKAGGHIGIFGPYRMKYAEIIPTVRYLADLVGELGTNW